MFSVTYEIWNEESSEIGDTNERGYIAESVSLREAVQYVFETRTNRVDGITAIEANESPVESPRWVTVYNGMEYLTGDYENRSIHFPENLTSATRCRIYRLIAG